MLIFTLIKILVAIPIAIAHHQQIQAIRTGIVFIIFIALIKYLLYKPHQIKLISHIVLITGIITIWSNLIIVVQQVNVITVQMAIMVILCSFYIIGGRAAVIYSAIAIFSILFYSTIKAHFTFHIAAPPQQLASPGYELTMGFNFLAIVIVHYLFSTAYQNNVKEKDLLNEELAIKVAEVKALADSKSLFLSTMSHELRTPLNAVIGITNLLKDDASPQQHENLEILEFSTVGLLTMVNDILDYHKSEIDKIELEQIPVHLVELLNKISSSLKPKATEKNISLTVCADENLRSKWVMTDPTRLTQIIYNLIGNSIKFTNRGKVELRINLLDDTDGVLETEFIIRDTGIGIADDKLETIFEPFTQASTDITRNFGGTGLGLTIVKKLLTLFNSSINVKSNVGKGSEFSFTIKFKVGEPKIQLANTLNNKAELSHLRILLAEDNSINAMLLQKMLANWGATTFWAKNGVETLSMINEQSIDLVLMDLQMPLMDGYEAATNIRALNNSPKSNIPIIALTASMVNDIHQRVIAAGMQDCLTKPYEPMVLYDKLKKYTEKVDLDLN